MCVQKQLKYCLFVNMDMRVERFNPVQETQILGYDPLGTSEEM